MTKYFLVSLAIGCGHCLIGVILYRGRAIDRIPVLQSDILVFLLPALVALSAYTATYWWIGFLQSKPGLRIMTMVGLSILWTGFSFWLSLLIAFNRYGT